MSTGKLKINKSRCLPYKNSLTVKAYAKFRKKVNKENVNTLKLGQPRLTCSSYTWDMENSSIYRDSIYMASGPKKTQTGKKKKLHLDKLINTV